MKCGTDQLTLAMPMSLGNTSRNGCAVVTAYPNRISKVALVENPGDDGYRRETQSKAPEVVYFRYAP